MVYVGIDLGTTNSVVSFAQTKRNGTIIANPLSVERILDSGTSIEGSINYTSGRSMTLPSCVYYLGTRAIVGDYAREQYKKYPELVAKSIKSQMGNPVARGLAKSVPDKTPEAISARILTHLKTAAEKALRAKVDDVIITVPANFDTARREATMRAAEIAGFNVREEDGSWKPILISEPNAVLYDLAQKIVNEEINADMFDLSSKQRVLVFDIGGGTLDVTFHELERDHENNASLNISEIAASRFTQLAGDDFDAAIADALYDRCVEKFRQFEPAALPRIRQREAMIKKMLTVAAEQLKINMNALAGRNDPVYGGAVDDWFNEPLDPGTQDEEVSYALSHSIGDERIYNDTITKSEFEAMLEPFLGKEYSFDDYRGYSRNQRIRRNTIVAPILDVLEKAARHYGKRKEELKVDAVVLNGGMSKLYLVRERIRDLFGIEPITTTDPDLSVANGAAVYAAMKEAYDLHEDHITIKRHVQNDDIYLGLSAGVNDLLIETGDELPSTKEIDGYRVIPGTRFLEIPIKRGEENGEAQTIARGLITFQHEYQTSNDLKIEADFDQTGLLTIKAFLYNKAGVQIENGTVEFAIGAPMEKTRGGSRIIPASGSELIPANEIDALKSLFANTGKNHIKRNEKNRLATRRNAVELKMDTILKCNNPEAFEDVLLKHLSDTNGIAFRYHLYQLVEGLAPSWGEEGLRRLREVAQRDIISKSTVLQVDERRNRLSEYVKGVLDRLEATSSDTTYNDHS